VNVYLENLRTKYEGIRTSIEGLQTRAADEKRDLTEEELRSIKDQGDAAKALFTEIESLTEIETRNRKVAELAGSLQNKGEETRATGNAQTRDRDPGHYRSEKDGGRYSFFGDLHLRHQGDAEATQRLAEHTRALSTGSAGVGVVPPRWMTDEFQEIARQGRVVAAAVRHIDLGDDPRPIAMPRQTAGTDTEVTEQAAENDPVEDDDAWASTTSTMTPKPTSGIQIVSRQMLDMSTPAIDELIWGDLLGAYNAKVETKVCTAMASSAGAAVRTFATNADFADPEDGPDAVVDTAIAVRNLRKLAANALICNVLRYGEILKWKDSSGRPLMPEETAGPMNVVGVGSVAVDGRVKGLGVLATDGLPSTFPESILVARTSDTILFESNVFRFKYEEVNGPESVKLGIWGYTGVHVKYSGASVRKMVVTDDGES
jgi:HK97 family phage major capsid protein